MAFTGQRGVDRVVDVDFGGNIATTLKLMAHEFDDRGLRHQRQPHARRADARTDGEVHRAARAGAVRAAAAAAGGGAGRHHEMAGGGSRASTTSPAQFALSDTAQAHLAVEKGDKLGTVIVDCAQ